MEEELRRYGPKMDVDVHEFLVQIFPLNKELHVKPFMDKFMKEMAEQEKMKNSGIAEKFKLIMKE